MHLAGVSTRRAEDIIEALWDSKVSPSAISVLNKKAYVQLRIGGSVLCKVGGIRVSTWMAIARFLVLLKAWERTRSAGSISFNRWMRGYELDKAKLVVRGKRRDTRRLVKRLLKRHKYPPEGMEDAVQTVMTQCELWTDHTPLWYSVRRTSISAFCGRVIGLIFIFSNLLNNWINDFLFNPIFWRAAVNEPQLLIFFDKFPHFIFGALLITARLNPFEGFLLMHNLWKILMQSMQKLIHDFILIFWKLPELIAPNSFTRKLL